MYLVGGAVRDLCIGTNPIKDWDYLYMASDRVSTISDAYVEMRELLVAKGYEILQEKPEHTLIKVRNPKNKQVYDFTISIKDGVPNRDIKIDLLDRDFTINAMAYPVDEDLCISGDLIDPCEGSTHLRDRLLITPSGVRNTLLKDPIRIIRAVRFSMGLNLYVDTSLLNLMRNRDKEIVDKLELIPSDRIVNELVRCFSIDHYRTMEWLFQLDSSYRLAILDRTDIGIKVVTKPVK